MLVGLDLQLPPDGREVLDHAAEVLLRDLHQFHVVEGRAARRALARPEQPHLAEVVAAMQVRQDHLTARTVLRHLHEPYADQIELVRAVALLADGLARLVADQLDAVAQALDELVREAPKQRHALQVRGQRALLVVLFDLFLEDLGAALEDVEDVAQHLQRCDVGLRLHRGAARVERHAGHLAEQIADAEAGDGVVLREVDGRVDRDAARVGVRGLVRCAPHERLEESEQTAPLRRSAQVGHGRGDVDARLTVQDVEGGRAELSFAADRLAGRVAPPDDRALVFLEQRLRAALEGGDLEHFVDGQGLALQTHPRILAIVAVMGAP